MKFAPTLKSWPRPPWPVMCQEKSSRNWYFFCSVVCGVLPLAPMLTLFGKLSAGAELREAMLLLKSAYWKMNSFSFEPPMTQLWFRLIELSVLTLSPQLSNVLWGPAPYGAELLLRP